MSTPARHTLELIGFGATATTSALGLSSSLVQVQQATASIGVVGPDWITLQLVGAISSLVVALVFVHRLLMQSEAQKSAQQAKGYELTISKTEAGLMSTVAAKDEFIRHQSAQLEQARVEAAELRAQKEQLVVRLLDQGQAMSKATS